jgi:predicted phage tail protein
VSEKEQPHWLPYGYVAVGAFAIAIVAFILMSGSAGFLDAIIFGLGVGAIVVGVKQLRARRQR